MRLKISFLKVHGSNGMVPLHHQKIISAFMEEVIQEVESKSKHYNFSSLKGTSKVMNGQIRFLSSKVSLVISAPEDEFVEQWIKKIFDRRLVSFAKLTLVPKSYQVISQPEFKTVMKYVCISPLICDRPFNTEPPPEPIEPTEKDFCDMIYNGTLDRMEHAGYSESQISEFAEFDVTPDPAYIQKVKESGKKFSRIYKTNDNETVYGYLLPFQIHAHPEVQKFIWESGIGNYTSQGFGMLDTVPEASASAEQFMP